ncbi:DUF4097 domain-containing protein [Paenibacillus motobuensis]|uniref:DUF4097 family beta strand repeat-containing protein n=1 Tax=Paenibacillus TaxID=44249 RepID=UPI00203BF23C|nr:MULTISPECIES: DUF4097 family beta strand repeat-containing protein [Paenibacillus]MCM3041956.1 DUF4097 domain-containing protein [Paenibacillus lutimineralis]MCM3649060.1 DUF4097 domain-containing protein [Paenibacillus motobuensis]
MEPSNSLISPEELKQKHKAGYKPRRRKRKFIACLLSALFPGFGHLYLQKFIKGSLFIDVFLIDLALLVYFSSAHMRINVPLLLVLGLLVTVVYFYSIYDVLQTTDAVNASLKRNEESEAAEQVEAVDPMGSEVGALTGIILISGGIIAFILRMKPVWLEGLIQNYGSYGVSVAMMLTGLIGIVMEGRRRIFRAGRLTASALLIAVAILMWIDVRSGQDYMLLLLKWWPLLLVLGGLELMLAMIWNRRKVYRPIRRLRIDFKGLLLSLCIGASVFAITQQDHYMHLWNRVSLDLASAGAEFSGEEGYRTDKSAVEIPIDLDTGKIVVNGINGDIDVKSAEINEVIMKSTVWIDQVPEEEARDIAEDTSVVVGEGKTLDLSVKDHTYGESGRRHPRVNITLIVPQNRFLDLDISTTSGSITLTGLQAMNQFKLQTGGGNFKFWDIVGEVSARTLNGSAELYRIFGNVQVDTQGGNIKAKGIAGDAALSTLVGNISLVNSQGNINVTTKNGNIQVDAVPEELKAESLNGKIQVSSSVVGGDWDVYSAVGEINLTLPEIGDYMIMGSSGYGNITSSLPFIINGKEISGISGSGDYEIQVEGNSDLIVNKR